LSVEKLAKLRGNHRKVHIFRVVPNWKINLYTFAILDKVFGLKWRAYFLARMIFYFRPYLVHFHEMQHGAYIMNLIVDYPRIPTNIKKVISTWGSDISLYSWVDSHQANLKTCFSWADLVSAEKKVEEDDARRLGFTKEFLAPVYIHLGISESELNARNEPPSTRKRILVKGYQGGPGRALNALEVLLLNRKLLLDFEILVFSADEPVRIQVDKMRNKFLMNIRTFSASHDAMRDYFSSARLSIGLSESDGLPASFVEAISVGCFAIQSQNSAAIEFISNGVNGFLVDPWNFEDIERSLIQGLTNDYLVDSASELNRDILRKKYNREIGIRNLRNIYI
jgi:glycosyltransferase involved in cell wall biosynthesis